MIELHDESLFWYPKTIIYQGKEYPAPQVIDLFTWNVWQVVLGR